MIGAIRLLRIIGISEGISFLTLLLIAMPLKYFVDFPLAVKIVGWAHGILFMAFFVMVLVAVKPMKWRLMDVLIAWTASLVPTGTFFLDRSLKRRLNDLNSQGEAR